MEITAASLNFAVPSNERDIALLRVKHKEELTHMRNAVDPSPHLLSAESDVLSSAIALRDAGVAVHWLRPRAKAPVAAGWSEAPVATAEQLCATYQAGYNLGVRLGEPSATPFGYLHAIDLDIRVADAAEDTWAAFERLLPGIRREDLPEVQSGSGGESRHLYFFSDRPFRSKRLWVSEGKFRDAEGSWHYDSEIELFGTGKQVAAPPSIHPSGQPYRWIRAFDFDGFDQPVIAGALIESLNIPSTTSPNQDIRPPLTFAPGELEYRLNLLPIDILDDRHKWLQLGQALHHQFQGAADGFDLWMRYAAKSGKHLVNSSVRAEQKRYRGFGRNRQQPVTMATVLPWLAPIEKAARDEQHRTWIDELDDLEPAKPAANDNSDEFSALLADADDDAVFSKGLDTPAPDAIVARINREHAVVMHAGRTLIATEGQDGSVDFGTATDLHTFYENRRIPKADARQGQTEPVSKYWLRHSERRTYRGGVTFAPGREIPGTLNLWRGWAVAPKPAASCERFIAHVREIVCRGEAAHANFVFGWLAHLVQRPEGKPGVALVLRGGKGAGKDTVADYLAAMIGRRHVPTVSHEKHIVGNFNRRLESALLFHVQEGTWAGNHQAESVLKYLVTSQSIEIERKGIDSFSLPSFLRLFISSNADWVVPASADERRWAVFNVSDARRGDEAYFRALRAEMDGDGPAALLAWLSAYDLSGFNVRAAPETDGLLEEKLASLRGFQRWWYDALTGGTVFARDGLGEDWGTTPITITRSSLRGEYETWTRARKFEGNPLADRQFGAELNKLVPELQSKRLGDIQRTRAYIIPPLPVCQAGFDTWIGGKVDWTEQG